jgi:hypothetical protein
LRERWMISGSDTPKTSKANELLCDFDYAA